MESVHSLGLFLLLFLGLPRLDVTRALLSLCALGFVPSLLQTLNTPSESSKRKASLIMALDIIATLVQLMGIVGWILYLTFNPLYYTDAKVGNSSLAQESVTYSYTDISSMCQEINRTVNDFTQHDPADIGYKRAQAVNMFKESTDWTFSYVQYSADDLDLATTSPGTSDTSWLTTTPSPTQPHDIFLAESLPETAFDLWPVPVGLFLISIAWWENFIDEDTKLGKLGKLLNRHRHSIRKGRTKLYVIVSFWKALLSFFLVMGFYAPLSLPWGVGLDSLFAWESFNRQDSVANRINQMDTDWLIVYGVQAGTCLFCFWLFKLSVRGLIQVYCVSVPLILSTPVTLALFQWACQDCTGLWDLPTSGFQFWNCFSGHDKMASLLLYRWAGMGITYWVAEIWIARHLWCPTIERLAKTDK